jgi:hypothetical protein
MRVSQVTHIDSRGLQIVIDEDVVRRFPGGQDMVVEFASAQNDHPVKNARSLAYGGVERQKGPKPKFQKLRSLETTISHHNLTTGAVYTLDNLKH